MFKKDIFEIQMFVCQLVHTLINTLDVSFLCMCEK